MSDVILRGAAGLFINPVNWEGVKGSLLQAKRSGVPCIVVDAPARDEDLVVCTVASDNVEAGRLACRALAKVNPDAQVVILHLSTDKTTLGKKGKSGIMKSMATRQEFLTDLSHRIRCVFTPKHRSWMNQIETVIFSSIAETVFQSVLSFMISFKSRYTLKYGLLSFRSPRS